MEHRVVITGLGIYSCLGTNKEDVTKALREGKSGIIFDQERKDMGFRSALTGMVERPDLKKLLKRRQRVGMAEEVEYAYMSTIEALEQAGISQEYLNENIAGIIFGNDSSARAVMESIDIVREKKDTTLVGSGKIFQSMNSTVTMNLATIFKLKGINFTVSAACASGSHSVGLGLMMIKQGYENIVICGGAQEINAYSMASFDGLGVFSTRENEPTKASRPFDRDRDGLIPSGGAATLILESLESAQKRGATILGEVVGYGFSSNGDHISNPNIDGKPAQFPAGVFDIASKLKVPVLFVFAMKDSATHYEFSCHEASGVGLKPEEILKDYINIVEKKLEDYPSQWFNYYQFWEK